MKHQNRFSAWKYSEVIGQDPKGPETVGPALSRRLGQMSPRRPNPHCSTCPWKASMRFYRWIDILFLKVWNKSNLHNFSVTMQNIWLTCHKKIFSTFGCMQSFFLSLFLNKNHHNADNLWKHYIIKYLGDICNLWSNPSRDCNKTRICTWK